MKLADLHKSEKPVSALSMFKGEEGNVVSLRILKGDKLPAHLTKVPALLVCVTGKGVFGDDNGVNEKLISGNYVNITPNVNHWVIAEETSDFLLIK